MWKLFAVSLAAATALGVHATLIREAPATPPTLRVSVFPYEGVIPAKFANGLPVYMFQASFEKTSADGETTLLLHDETLLQRGMSERLHRKSGELELRGAITIEQSGAARYAASVSDGSAVIVASTAQIGVGDGSRGRKR